MLDNIRLVSSGAIVSGQEEIQARKEDKDFMYFLFLSIWEIRNWFRDWRNLRSCDAGRSGLFLSFVVSLSEL